MPNCKNALAAGFAFAGPVCYNGGRIRRAFARKKERLP